MFKLAVWAVLLLACVLAWYWVGVLVSVLGLTKFAKLLLIVVGSVMVVWTLWEAERVA